MTSNSPVQNGDMLQHVVMYTGCNKDTGHVALQYSCCWIYWDFPLVTASVGVAAN